MHYGQLENSECWPRTLTDLLQAHENGGQRSQNGEKGLNSISSLKLPLTLIRLHG